MALSVPSWLNKEFIERILKSSENDDSIRVINIDVKPATNKGDNFTSDMLRVTVELTRHQGSKKVTEKQSLILKKTLPEGRHKQLIDDAGLFNTEIKMMTTTLKEMETFLKDTKLHGKCLYTQDTNPTLLIIEDLAPLGFRMANRHAGLDLQHCMLAIRGLAKFHASSVAACEKVAKYKEQYDRGIFNTKNPEEMISFFTSGMKTLAKCVTSCPELGESYANKIMNISELAYKRASESGQPVKSEFNVINHGDFWVNNMLFRYDDKGNAIDHIFVDFQFCVYASPALDLTYFFNTSPAEEVSIKHRDSLMDEYLKVLTTTMRKIGCKTAPPSMSDLKSALNKKENYGFVAACTILPIVLAEKSDAQNLEEIMGQDASEFNNKAYANPAYMKAMSRRLQIWNKLGLLDA